MKLLFFILQPKDKLFIFTHFIGHFKISLEIRGFIIIIIYKSYSIVSLVWYSFNYFKLFSI